MDKIIAISESSPQISEIDEGKFVRFIQRTPIWEYFKITQQKYLSYSTEENTAMISDYYKGMDNGKNLLFFLVDASDLWRDSTVAKFVLMSVIDNKPFDLGASSSKMLSPQKANIMSLSREISDSDRIIRSKVAVANIDGEKRASEAIWEDDGYFGALNPDFSIHKKDFTENTLIYISQAYLTIKEGEAMI